MKKIINYAFIYTIIGLASGVYYREFTKIQDFRGTTTLSFIHTHTLVLGSLFLLIAAILVNLYSLETHKLYKPFLILFNLGLPLTLLMMFIRGNLQVLGTQISSVLDASISGFAGIGHTCLGLSLIFIFLILKKQTKTA